MKVVTAEQMRALDRRATEEYGIPSLILMENAGRAVYEVAMDMLGEPYGKYVVVVAGPGNNGGDGFVVARHLQNNGVDVTIAYYGDRQKARGDALTNIEIAEKMGLDIASSPSSDELLDTFNEADLIIDALLGTGVAGIVREPFDQVIEAMNAGEAPVLAVDIPSGLDADTGVVMGVSVWADATVTFALPKIGLLTYPGALQVGQLFIEDISIPVEALEENDSEVYVLEPSTAAFVLGMPRRRDAHKGDFGHLAIVAGSVGMTGAATLAATAALRIGAGLVTLAVPESLNDIFEVKLTEAMTVPVPQGDVRAFGMASLDKVLEVIQGRDAVVVGPGFGRDEDTISFTLELIRHLSRPAIIDADGLYALSKGLGVLHEPDVPLVVTPHPGEMAMLLGTTISEVQSNRLEIARRFAQEYGVTVVLKGAATLVAEPDGAVHISRGGTPAMATGGTGDVLSGMIGGLLAYGLSSADAATGAVFLHSRAGEIAAAKLGEASVIASDVADCISDVIRELREKITGKGVSED